MRKVLLDTSIILDDTNNLVHLFECGDMIFISDVALEELDRKKDLQSESGYFAREFFRCVSEYNSSSVTQDSMQNENLQNLDSKTNEKEQVEQSSTINGNVRSTQPCEPAQLAVQKSENTSAVVRTSLFCKELDKRGSPPLRQKSGCFFSQRGSGVGDMRFFAQSANDNQNNDLLKNSDFGKVDSIESKNIDSKQNNIDVSLSLNMTKDSKNLQNIDSKQNTESIESITPLNDDFIATLEFKTQSYKIPLHIITRKKYKTQSSDYGYNDARIREIAKDYNLVLLTNDIALKVRSLSEGIRAKSLKNGQISNPKEINFISKITLKRDLSDKAEFESSPDFTNKTNWHIFEISECDFTDSARYFTGRKYFGVKVNNALEILDLDSIIKENKPYILPLNIEQKLAYALLIHPQNFLSIITGSTGSGKTLMALLAGLTLQKLNKVDGIIYLRNTITANDKEAELGFRKGDESQKLHYFMYPLFSSINFIIESLKEHSEAKRIEYKGEAKGFDKDEATYYFLQKHNIEMLDIAHARGISLHNKFVIFDEVQNASNATIKLIGTRIGENSRIVFLGDYNQIDHPYLSKTRNGAISMLNKALSEDFVFGLQFKHTIRSILASWFDANF